MKLFNLLPLAALSTAFVILDDETANNLEFNTPESSVFDKLPSKEDLVPHFQHLREQTGSILDDAFSMVAETGEKLKHKFQCTKSMTAFDTDAWLASAAEADFSFFGGGEDSPHHGPHHGPHHRHGKYGHYGHKPNRTVYELIAESKYTTKLAKLINEDGDLVKLLNSTTANFTIFAPIDKAFEKLPKHHKKPSKEIIKKVLLYHVSPEFYPAGRVLASHTIPSALVEESLGNNPQRLRLGLGLKGLTVNFYSRVIAINIFGTNGVIHGVDSLILPPPPGAKIIEFLPGTFSTLQLALIKTGLDKAIKDGPHAGGTLFAPTNNAFAKLGPKINAFLFSKYGAPYLAKLLEYHVSANNTLYSDAFYKAESTVQGIPKGYFHVDLPTLLGERSLSVDVARYGGFISMKINGFTTVAVQDGIARDGVLQVLSSVLIPPKTAANGEVQEWMGEEMSLEEFKERLGPVKDQKTAIVDDKLDL